MQDIISRLRAKKQDEGFTLIELLVVVVIIGVLVAIAVPVYLNYRKGAADKSAQSDVRGAISAVEQFYTDNGNAYPVASQRHQQRPERRRHVEAHAAGDRQRHPGTITLSDKTQLAYVNKRLPPFELQGLRDNTGGSGKWYLYDSSAGGSVKAAAGTLTVATCAP
jgi:type IV pilus assembly protein PilA